jgi:hypothetical protein
MSEEIACSKCAGSMNKDALSRCPICYKLVCDDCRYQMSGRSFCSAPCAQYYFFEEEEF